MDYILVIRKLDKTHKLLAVKLMTKKGYLVKEVSK